MASPTEYIWAQKYRPLKLADMVLSENNRQLLQSFIDTKQIPHLLLSGPPGAGKTTLAKVLVQELSCDKLYINASDENGIETIRHKVVSFSETRSFSGGIKIVLLDEADGLSGNASSGKSSAQQALRNIMEEYSATTRFILTANYPSKIIAPLHSRCQQIEMTSPFNDCVRYCVSILKREGVSVDASQKTQLSSLIKSRYPDMRKIINSLQQYTINGVLNITEEEDRLFIAQKIFALLLKKADLTTIRTYLISNENEFADYHDVLRDLFEVIYKSEIESNKKASMLLVVTEAMYRHNLVMDQEINMFSAVIQLSQIA